MRTPLRALIIAVVSLALLLVPTIPAEAKTPRPPKELVNQAVPLDAHLGYMPQTTCAPTPRPGTKALLKLLITTWGGSSSGISRGCTAGGRSEHKEGRALDWHMSVKSKSQRKRVDQALTWMTANNGEVAIRLGVMYIIWNQRIWSTYYPELGWRKMADRGSATQNHKDHVHISLSWDGAMKRTSWWTGVPVTHPLNSKCSGTGVHACLPTAARASGQRWKKVKAPIPFMPTAWKTPSIGGSPRVGLTLTAVPGTWVPAGATVGYRWLIGGKAIPGATGATYVPTARQVGKVIRLEVTAAGRTKSFNNLEKVVKGVFIAPQPKLTGQVAVGQQIGVDLGTWKQRPSTVSYQWKRNGKKITKATSARYTPTKSDLGKKLTVTVTARAAGYVTKSVTSAASKVAAPLLQTTAAPVVSGDHVVGRTLTASQGTWSPTPTALAYQWYADGVAVQGATRATFTLTQAQAGTQVSVRVKATRSGYSASYAWSTPVLVTRPSETVIPTPNPAQSPTPTPNQTQTPTPSQTTELAEDPAPAGS